MIMNDYSHIKNKIYNFISEYNGDIQGNTLHLSVLCDDSSIYLNRIIYFLENNGFTDIKCLCSNQDCGIYKYNLTVDAKIPDFLKL